MGLVVHYGVSGGYSPNVSTSGLTGDQLRSLKGNQKGNITCYARERANTKQPF